MQYCHTAPPTERSSLYQVQGSGIAAVWNTGSQCTTVSLGNSPEECRWTQMCNLVFLGKCCSRVYRRGTLARCSKPRQKLFVHLKRVLCVNWANLSFLLSYNFLVYVKVAVLIFVRTMISIFMFIGEHSSPTMWTLPRFLSVCGFVSSPAFFSTYHMSTSYRRPSFKEFNLVPMAFFPVSCWDLDAGNLLCVC